MADDPTLGLGAPQLTDTSCTPGSPAGCQRLRFAYGPVTVNPGATLGGTVRMEFGGDSWGEQTYIGRVSGLQYRAGRDPSARFKDVDARDVEYFVQTGLFVVVTAPALTNTVEDVPIVPIEPRQQAARVKGRRVNA